MKKLILIFIICILFINIFLVANKTYAENLQDESEAEVLRIIETALSYFNNKYSTSVSFVSFEGIGGSEEPFIINLDGNLYTEILCKYKDFGKNKGLNLLINLSKKKVVESKEDFFEKLLAYRIIKYLVEVKTLNLNGDNLKEKLNFAIDREFERVEEFYDLARKSSRWQKILVFNYSVTKAFKSYLLKHVDPLDMVKLSYYTVLMLLPDDILDKLESNHIKTFKTYKKFEKGILGYDIYKIIKNYSSHKRKFLSIIRNKKGFKEGYKIFKEIMKKDPKKLTAAQKAVKNSFISLVGSIYDSIYGGIGEASEAAFFLRLGFSKVGESSLMQAKYLDSVLNKQRMDSDLVIDLLPSIASTWEFVATCLDIAADDISGSLLGLISNKLNEIFSYFTQEKTPIETIRETITLSREVAKDIFDEFNQLIEKVSKDWSILEKLEKGGQQLTVSSNTILVIDVSGSMGKEWRGETKLDSATKAAVDFLTMVKNENFMGNNHRVGVVIFSDTAETVSPLTDNLDELINTVMSIGIGGGTNIGDGLNKAYLELSQESSDIPSFTVLLTDGMSNRGLTEEEILNSLIPNFVDKKIKIYTIGFGDRGNINETFLEQLATATGGDYLYADEAWTLENIFIKMRHKSLGKIANEFEGEVAQGETKSIGFINVINSNNDLYVSLNWPGSDLDLILKDPAGRVVDENYPNAEIFRDVKPEYMIVKRPRRGKWNVSVYGKDVPEGSINFKVISSFRPMSNFEGSSSLPVVMFIAIVILFLTLSILYFSIWRKGISINYAITDGNTYYPIATKMILGRGIDSTLRLKDSYVSRRHAEIFFDGRNYIIRDLGSKNGTYVNGERVNERVLREGDEIRIGRYKFIFKRVS